MKRHILCTTFCFAWIVCSLGCSPADDPASQPSRTEPVPLEPAGAATTLASGAALSPLGYEAEVNARVAGVDLDGDGREEIAVASAREVAIVRVAEDGSAAVVWRGAARGGATAIASGDIDGDGRSDLVVGWGIHRDHLDAPAELVAYRTAGGEPDSVLEEVVVAPTTSRAQFSSIQIAGIPGGDETGVLYGNFASKYEVRGGFATLDANGAWRDRTLHRIRMGAELIAARPGPDLDPVLVVGRPYGDEVKSHGDVFALDEGGARQQLASVRGVRSLAAVRVGPSDTPVDLVCYGDGWHWRYKAEGRGLLTCARRDRSGAWEVRQVAELDSFSVSQIAAADLNGDGSRELLAMTPDGLHRFAAARAGDELTWTGRPLGPGAAQFAVVDLDGDGRQEVVLAGERPSVLRLP